jgi:ABC-type Fe3+/spermidine/putrescine transport system ATPase subunit
LLVGHISQPAWTPRPGDEALLSIRPEAWRLHKTDGENPLPGTVAERAYLGQRIQYWIETPLGRQQVVEMNPHLIHEPGDQPLLLHARHEDTVVLQPQGGNG